MCRDCEKFLSTDLKILDLGCGSGIISKEFERSFSSEFLGIDIIDNRIEVIPFKKYKGDNLSFLKDNSFDLVLINFVLHHCQNPEELLKEAKRVSSGKIVLYENLPEGIISSFSVLSTEFLLLSSSKKIQKMVNSILERNGKKCLIN